MIITPARFEDEIQHLPDIPDPPIGMLVIQPELYELMCETLISLGYEAGIKAIKDKK